MVAPLEVTSHEHEPIDGEIFLEDDLVDAGPSDLVTLPDGVDQEWLLGELWKDLLRGEHAKAVLAEAQMRRVIEFNRSLEHRMVDGIGQIQARVPLEVFLHWKAREGDDFWRERSNLDFFARRNPGFRIDTFHRRTCVTVEHTLPASHSGAEAPAGLVKTARAGAGEAPALAKPAPRIRGRRGRWAS